MLKGLEYTIPYFAQDQTPRYYHKDIAVILVTINLESIVKATAERMVAKIRLSTG